MSFKDLLNSIPSPATQAITKVVRDVLDREDVHVETNQDVSNTTSRVVASIKADPTVAVVPVTSPLTSKTNWTAVIIAVLTLLTAFGVVPNMDDATKLHIVTVLVTVGAPLIVVFKTWFSNSITKQSKG